MSNSEDKFNTNVPVDPLLRLASFKPPRDLSLGGLKPNKKVFTPNLNVARKKQNSVTPSNSKVVKKEEKNKKDRKSDKNLKNGPKVIRSTGVFSEGLGSVERHHHSRVSYGRDSEPAQALQKPTIKMENIVKIDYDDEEQKIREAYGEEWYEAECETFSDEEAPIKLPPNGSLLNTDKKPGVIKQEVIVKAEPRDYDDNDHRGDDNHHRDKGDGDYVEDVKPVSIGKMFVKQTDVTELLKNDKPTLIFLQLPDILPGRGGDDDFRRKHDEPSTSEADDNPQQDNRCRLKDLQEGRIGTMRVHRSGKVTMYIGDTLYEVSTGIRPSFHQELVSTAVDDTSRSANLISLGDLQNKLDITPHWESIFEKMST